MQAQLIDRRLKNQILAYLGVAEQKPTLRYLNLLIAAYTRTVPWESVSRIHKRRTAASITDCPRWPDEFWSEAIALGTGGTCYESSMAFYGLLASLGYQGYLTVNDMGPSRGCHAAVIVILDGQKYLVDVTIPVHAAVRVDPDRITRRRTLFHNYLIRPESSCVYQVERSHHPHRNAFTLMDVPVSLEAYREIVARDYLDTGHFLKEVVIVKVIGGAVWRFNSADDPLKLVHFNREGKVELLLSPATAAQTVAGRFQLPVPMLSRALAWVQNSPPPVPANWNQVPVTSRRLPC
jgi:arylamine N-acetyltransferase